LPSGAGQLAADAPRLAPRLHCPLPPAGHLPRTAPAARAGRAMTHVADARHGFPLFEALDVTKTFGGLTAVQRVTFTLDGGIASIIGPNGAGKTTLFNVFTGLYPPDGGSVSFRGQALVGLRPDEITALGVCRPFQ